MSRKRKATKAAPIKLIWLEQIIEHKWPKKPAKATIVAVAAKLVTYGDRAGKGIYPAAETIANPLGIKRQTVFDVLKVMVAEGMLTRQGKTNYNTNIYDLKLAPKADENELESVPQSVPQSVTPRGTQSSSLSRKGERDDEYSPTPAAKAAVAGIELSRIEGEQANQIITNFITAFDSAFAARPRSSTLPTASLEPSHPKLRAAIIAKHEAAWPLNHLIERTLKNVTNDERDITTLAGLVASILNRLPADLDATARKAIEAEKVAAGAKDVEQATRAEREASAEKVMEELIALDDEAFDIIHEICKTLHPDDGDEYDALHRVLENRISQVEKEHDLGELGHDNINADNFEALGARLRPYYQECIRVMKGQRKNYLRHINKTQRSITS
jgi:hypothetical protein